VGAYAKAFIAMLGAVATAFIAVVTDNAIAPIEVVNLGLIALGAFAVYVTPNLPGYSAAKAIILALTAGLQYVVSAIETDADLNWTLWAQVIATAVAALVAYFIPNRPAVVTD
jgi:3-polyprenyl-4-hydroxybenzoate decarboxylase